MTYDTCPDRCGGHLELLNGLKNGLLTKLIDQSHGVWLMRIGLHHTWSHVTSPIITCYLTYHHMLPHISSHVTSPIITRTLHSDAYVVYSRTGQHFSRAWRTCICAWIISVEKSPFILILSFAFFHPPTQPTLCAQMKKHTTTVMSAMVTGMDDRNDPEDLITLEAMNGLSKIIAKVLTYLNSHWCTPLLTHSLTSSSCTGWGG